MTPKELIDFMETYDFCFYDFLEELEFRLKDLDEKGKERLENIGEFEFVDSREYVEDDKRRSEFTITHFKTLGFYVEERTDYVWGELSGREYHLVEPVGQKVVFGNHVKISD